MRMKELSVAYHSEHGVVQAIICKVGRKFAHLVWIDYPIRLRKIPKSDLKYCRETGRDHTGDAESMLEIATRVGITKGAEQALRGVL